MKIHPVALAMLLQMPRDLSRKEAAAAPTKEIDLKEWPRVWEEWKKANDARLALVEKGQSGQADYAEKMAKIGKDLDSLDAKWAKFQADLDAKLRDIEASTKNPLLPGGRKDKEEILELRKSALCKMVRGRQGRLTDEEKAALDSCKTYDPRIDGDTEVKATTIGYDPNAGFLVPLEMIKEIIKPRLLFNPIRSFARVRQTSSAITQIPKKTGAGTATYVNEVGTRPTDSQTGDMYGMWSIPNHEQTATLIISRQALEDAGFDMQAEFNEEFGNMSAILEGVKYTNGSGQGCPQGITVSPIGTHNVKGTIDKIALYTFADTSGHLIAAPDLIGMQFLLSSPYEANARWYLNRQQQAKVRSLKNPTTNDYLMAPLREGMPPTILGLPYSECPDLLLDGTAAGRSCVILGDLSLGYTITDRLGMVITRDDLTLAGNGKIKFTMYRRHGGQVTNGEAIVLGKTG